MIKSWKHNGLKQFFQTGTKSGIQPAHARRLTIILQFLDSASRPEDMDLPGMRFHPLVGNYYALQVSGNWRVIFQFDGEDAVLVDYIDYH